MNNSIYNGSCGIGYRVDLIVTPGSYIQTHRDKTVKHEREATVVHYYWSDGVFFLFCSDWSSTYNLRYASSKELNDEMNYKKKSTQNDLDVSSGINLVPDLSSLVHYSQLTHPFSSVFIAVQDDHV